MNPDYIILAIIGLLAAIPIVYGFYYVDTYGVNVPLDDQWDTIVPWTISYYEGTFDPAVLIQEQNDSRPVFSNILMLLISVITKMNLKIIFFVGYIIYTCSILFICYLVLKELKLFAEKKYTYLYLFLLLPVLYYAFNPYYLFRFIYNIGSLSAGLMVATAVLTIYLLDLSYKQVVLKKYWAYAIAAAIMGFICTSTGAPGLSIWIVGFFQIIFQNEKNRIKKLLVWLMSAGLTIYWYFFALGFKTEGIHGTEGYSAYLLTAVTYPANKFLCYLGVLGSEVVHDQDFALFFGGFILAIFIALLYVNRKCLNFKKFSKWYALLLFGALTSLELALVRSGTLEFSSFGAPDTIFYIPSIRHSPDIFLPLMCIFILTLLYMKESNVGSYPQKVSDNDKSDTRAGNFMLCGMLLMLMICACVCHIIPGISAAEQSYETNENNQYYLLSYDSISDSKLVQLDLAVPLRLQDIRTILSPKLKEWGLCTFSDSPLNYPVLKFSNIAPDSKVDSSGKDLEAYHFTQETNKKIGNLSIPAIFEHPQNDGSILTYDHYVIPENAHLKFYIGIDPGAWTYNSSDGVTFEIHITNTSDAVTTVPFSKSINPAHNTEEQSWLYQDVDLSEYGNQTVNIEFVTRPNGNAKYDWAWWGDPKLYNLCRGC